MSAPFEDLGARLRAHADADPARAALSFGHGDDPNRVDLSYGDLLTRSDAVAAAIADRLAPGERALLLFPSVPEFAAAFLGCLAAGVIAVPVPIPIDENARRRVLNVVRDCSVSLIVSVSFIHDFAASGPAEVRELRETMDWLLVDTLPDAPGAARRTVAPADIAFLQYTSGSTGNPRGVMVSHGALMANEEAIRRSFDVRRDSTIVSWLPLHHDMGLIGAMLQPLYAGARGVILDPLSFVRRPASWLETISRERADISGGPNFAYDLCVRKVTDEEKAGLDLSSWRVAFNGAAQVYPRTLRQFSEAFQGNGFRASAHLPCYGLAEATLLVTATDPATEYTSGTFDGRELVAYPLPEHADVRIVHPETLEPVADGTSGEIVVSGDSNGSGFWGQPGDDVFALTVDGSGPFLRTGDLGFRSGDALYVEGRGKDLVIQRGRNIHPEDLEADISRCHADVRPGCGVVFGVEHDGDEAVVVAQEVRDGTARYPEVARAIREAVSRIHGVHARTVLLVPPRTITKTSSGKVQRHAAKVRHLGGELPTLFADTVEESTASLAARLGPEPDVNALTSALCDHLRDLLSLSTRPTGDESLAGLGADSLTAVRVRQEVEEALGVTLPASAVLRAESIADIARAAVAAARATRSSDVDFDGTLTAGQQALWFLQRAVPDNTSYNVTRAFRLTGPVDVDALSASLDALVARHPSLRLTVHAVDGVPHGVVGEPAHVEIESIDAREWPDVTDWFRDYSTTPFDLEHGPLLRVALLHRADDALLVLSLHHIVCDMTSVALLVAELTGTPAPEAHISPTAREAAVLAERGDELAEFWRTTLGGELPRLELPELGRGDQGDGASLRFEVAAGDLIRFAQAAGLTTHNVLLAAYQLLLHRLTGQNDLIVGVPTSGRDDRALAGFVGFLVNVVPIRSAYQAGVGFADFAGSTQRTVLDALDHQELPLSHITRLVNPDRDTATASVFQAMFAYYPGGEGAMAAVLGDPDTALPLAGATLRGHQLPDYTTQADLCLNVAVRGDSLAFEVQHDPQHVSREQAEQVASTFRTLLAAIAAAPTTDLRRLPLLDPAEATAMAAAGAGPVVPRTGDYLDTFAEVVRRSPDVVAADDGTTTITYAELDARSNHVARWLRERGVGIDSNVVVSGARSVDYLVIMLGVHKADGCYVPITPAEAPRRAAAMLDAVRPVATIADASGRKLLPDAVDLAELASGRAATAPPRLSPVHGANYIIHTSGSTGVPKAAISTNGGVTNHLWQMVEYFGLGSDDCVAQTGPVSFDVSVWQMFTPLIVGGRVRIVPEPDSLSPAGLLRAHLDGRVTLLELVPSAVAALLDAGLADDTGALRIMIPTGEALSPDLPRRWRREVPHVPMYNAYGPCECTDDVSIGLVAHGPDVETSTSIGRALSNTTMFLLDEDGVPTPTGVAGKLCVGGLGVGRGYLGDPRKTAAAFLPDPWSPTPGARMYHTGDLARVNPAGGVEFIGRADTQIKIRGLRIEAGEVEAALRECDGVTDAAVKAHKGVGGGSLVGYLVMGDTAETAVVDAAEDTRLRTALADRLPRHMIPTVLVRVPALPRSMNGKTDYKALDYTPVEPTESSDVDISDDPTAAALRGIWADLLGRETITADDRFFALGGHSLLALALVDRVARVLGVDITVDAVFTHQRFIDLLEVVRAADPARPRGERVTDPSLPVPASAAQQRFWYLREIDPDRPTYNMPGVLRLRGELDESALETALRDTLARHPILLARFAETDGALTWTPGSTADFELSHVDLRGPVAEFGDEVFDRVVEEEANRVADLRGEIPFRALLARLGPKDWGLFVNIDHIACDGWSLGVFLADLAAAYNGKPLAAPAYTFADYCHDERTWSPDTDLPDSAGPFALSPLPERPGGEGAGRYTHRLGAETGQAVRDLAARTGTTPFMVFAAALASITAEAGETALFGTLVAERARPELRDVVGPLLNVSVLTIDGPDLLRSARDAAIRAHRTSHIPFQELMGRFPAAPGGDGSPFEVMLVLQPGDVPVEFDGLETELVDVDTDAAPYPLTVDIEPLDGDYRVSYRYAADRYAADDVEALAARFATAITTFTGPEGT